MLGERSSQLRQVRCNASEHSSRLSRRLLAELELEDADPSARIDSAHWTWMMDECKC